MVLKRLLNKNKKKKYQGGVEFVSPSLISGWIYSEKTNYNEIRILFGPYLVASAKVNIYRQDVSSAINKEGNFGFCFELDNIDKECYKYTQSYTPKLIAYNADLTSKIEVQSISKKENLIETINTIFQEKIVGSDGHVDGYASLNNNNNEIIGWAINRVNESLIFIWMLSSDRKLKMKIECNNYRGDIDSSGMINECGFIVRIEDLDNSWINKNVNFFFDEKGLFPLPGKNEISIYNTTKYNDSIAKVQVIKYEDDLDYLVKAGNSSEELRYKWLQLNQKKNFLDLVDEKLFKEKIETNKFKLILNKLKPF